MSNENWTEESDVNWNDVPEGAPKPLDLNLYNGKIVKADFRLSKATPPNMCINLEIALTSVFQGDELATPKRHYDTLVFTQKSAFKVKGCARAADVLDQLPKRINEEAVREFADALLGRELVIKNKHEKHHKDASRTISVVANYFTAEQAEAHKAGRSVEEPKAEEPVAIAGRRRKSA